MDRPAHRGFSQARTWLGADPVKDIFRRCDQHRDSEHFPDDNWQGLQMLAVDGALLRTADTPELRGHFGSGNTGTDRQTPYPLMHLIALMNVRSRVMLDARLSPVRRDKTRLAERFLEKIQVARSPCWTGAFEVRIYCVAMAAAQPASASGERLPQLKSGVASLFLEHRPRPTTPRTVRIFKARYPVDGTAAPLK